MVLTSEFTGLTPKGKQAVRTSRAGIQKPLSLVATWEQENNKEESCPGSHQPGENLENRSYKLVAYSPFPAFSRGFVS